MKTFLPLIFVLFFLSTFTASANLLIYPVRVSFDDKERTAELTLTNTSQTTNTYRLGWRENKALPEGGYEAVEKQHATELAIASPMLRFAPRQVTLKPGERQVIKLALRRPRNLADGEYRSHLLFRALPPAKEAREGQGTSMQINMIMSFAVPVSVQQGTYNASVAMDSAKIEYHPGKKTGVVKVTMTRQGMHSSSGDLTAYWTPTGGKERMIAKLADYNFWAELQQATANLIWANGEFEPGDGTLRIEYKGVRDFSGNTYLNNTIKVKKSDIQILAQ